MKSSINLAAALLLTALLASCAFTSKKGLKELEGEWIYEVNNANIRDGKNTYYLYEIQEYDFSKERVVVTYTKEIDGDLAYKVSVDGDWQYVEGPFIGSKAEGVIEILYDMDSFTVERLNKEYRNQVDELKEELERDNRKLERLRSQNDDGKKSSNSFFGYFVKRFGTNKVVLQSEEGDVEWLRPSVYDKDTPYENTGAGSSRSRRSNSYLDDEETAEAVEVVEVMPVDGYPYDYWADSVAVVEEVVAVSEGLPIYGYAANRYPNYKIGNRDILDVLPSGIDGHTLTGSGYISQSSVSVNCVLLFNGQIVGRYHNTNGINLDVNGYVDSDTGTLHIKLGHDSEESLWTLYPDYSPDYDVYVYTGVWGRSNKPSSMRFRVGDYVSGY